MILHLVVKDLRRDMTTAWQPILLCLVPLISSGIIAVSFSSGNGEDEFIPQINVAMYDKDEGLISGFLGSMAGQSDVNSSLRIFNVESEEEGFAMLEHREASAFIILPERFSDDLLDGATTTIRVYENPAELMLPRAVVQGTEVLASVLSIASDLLGEPLREMDAIIKEEEWPDPKVLSEFVVQSSQQVRDLEYALFPPIVGYSVVPAHEYVLSASREVQP